MSVCVYPVQWKCHAAINGCAALQKAGKFLSAGGITSSAEFCEKSTTYTYQLQRRTRALEMQELNFFVKHMSHTVKGRNKKDSRQKVALHLLISIHIRPRRT
jgi:hypothetical protein